MSIDKEPWLLTSHCRCETEERNTRRLEQQVDLLRQSKSKTDQNNMALQADIRHSVTELQEMHQEFEVTKRATSSHVCLPASHCGFLFLYFLLATPVLSPFLCLLWVSLATRRKPSFSVSPHLQVSQMRRRPVVIKSKQSKPAWVLDVKSITSTKCACIK